MKENNEPPNFQYAQGAKTKITLEVPCDTNAYIAEKRYTFGYDTEDLLQKTGFIGSLLLIFRGELPAQQDIRLLETLMVTLINSGPRDTATRAAMTAAVSKANPEHLLCIGLLVGGGINQGAAEVANAYTFIKKNVQSAPTKIASSLRKKDISPNCFPGFGTIYGSIDTLTQQKAQYIYQLNPHSSIFSWCAQFNAELNKLGIGILETGLAASVFLELELGARESIGLYQLLKAPSILAHGLEQTHNPITAMPLLDDEQYDFHTR